MGVDSHFRHTCQVERGRTVPDSYNADKIRWPPEIPPHLVGQHCRFIVKEQRVGDTAFAERPVITVYTLLVGARTDVKQRDRITNIRDKQGTLVDAGPFEVREILPRSSTSIHHITLRLERP